MTLKVTSANGVTGCLLKRWGSIGPDGYMFRVYSEDKTFKDYDLFHTDLFVTITDEDAFFYEDGDKMKIDHSTRTLGIV